MIHDEAQRISLSRALRADPSALEALMASLLAEQRIPTEGDFLALHRSIMPHSCFRTGAATSRATLPIGCRNWHMMEKFFVELGRAWAAGDALDVAALALWRPVWIHPFDDGNGRTARGFSYACLCAKLGAVPSGTPTVIEQMTLAERRGFNHITAECEAVLSLADKAAMIDPDARDLAAIRGYLVDLLRVQTDNSG